MSGADAAVVFDVQRFSIHDGPGIRTVVFFKGCALACRWCQNPESRRAQPELAYHADRCLPGCRLCVSVCPEGAILDRMNERVRWDACTHCGACVDTCPSDALVMVGEQWTVERLLDAVLADRHFYEASGGGVTLSGGEPVLASDFLSAFLPRAKQAGLHLTLETSGHYPFALLEPLLPELDLILFDVKAGGRERHLDLVGHDNHQVLANLERLLARDSGPELELRMPVVPGLNDGDASLDQLCATLRGLGVERLTLLPYNHLWEAKLARLDTKQTALGISPPAKDYYRALEQRFAARGVTGLAPG
ncbi:4-hydroxyphenylacetate decarboxylase activating enzyme [Enhygromyxa salina]|uniref:4-hydroxyphenylacetate decarboxylase activating enzyme n=1 Tax=Enhygromyxa salina TaxID=215803 RepID=A0A2S9XXM3_9BACT|nr:glycyl-radical enzyme activating protein [Enhygromyxa salina]PRP97615.1 4-hydroxyphenylacetate decarboxylase activating enzyme [Enhygromyxa salina]